MNEKWIETIRRNLDMKSTDELRQILQKHDTNEYTEEAFIAIQRILDARGVDLTVKEPPAVDAQVNPPSEAVEAVQLKRPGCVTAFSLLVMIGAGLSACRWILTALFGPNRDEGTIIGAVVALALSGFYIAVAFGLWELKSWARIAIIILLGLSILLLVILLFFGFYPGIIGVITAGICLFWFATHEEVFVPAT